jgi:hypothetical protein
MSCCTSSAHLTLVLDPIAGLAIDLLDRSLTESDSSLSASMASRFVPHQ